MNTKLGSAAWIMAGIAVWTLAGCDSEKSPTAFKDRSDRPLTEPTNPWMPRLDPGVGVYEGSADAVFLEQACQANLAEVQLGRMADIKAYFAEVRTFAQRMVEDHEAANRELGDLARKKGWVLPDQPDDEHLKALAELGELAGPEFDRTYMGKMVSDHQAAVAFFEAQDKRARDQDVRAFAAKMLPKLREHAKLAKEVNEKVGSLPLAD